MGARLEKLKRMSTSTQNDELPLVAALKRVGCEAWRNEGVDGKMNRKLGDVSFRLKKGGPVYSIEVQVVGSQNRYSRFSYGVDKVKLYRGAGSYDDAFVLLGCYERTGGDEMIFVACQAPRFHKMLEDGGGNSELHTPGFVGSKPYYTVTPESVVSLEGSVVGATIEEATHELVQMVRTTQKGVSTTGASRYTAKRRKKDGQLQVG